MIRFLHFWYHEKNSKWRQNSARLSRRSFAAVGTTRLEVHPSCALKSSIAEKIQVKEDFVRFCQPSIAIFFTFMKYYNFLRKITSVVKHPKGRILFNKSDVLSRLATIIDSRRFDLSRLGGYQTRVIPNFHVTLKNGISRSKIYLKKMKSIWRKDIRPSVKQPEKQPPRSKIVVCRLQNSKNNQNCKSWSKI